MATVRRTGSAAAAAGGYANTGLHLGNVYMTAPAVARSAYREQVERIAPDKLVGRETELAELAAFCTASSGCRYAWWQAPAWAGKSALMSWFVLHPPAGVRVVSFFITARYAGNSDRNAFLDVMLEQLAEVAEQPLPQFLTEATRELWLLKLLKDAALTCADSGQRLALVVDGLDEDQGVTVGPEAHSIAALLPSRLPEAVRVVVAGRPNPPIPADVLDDHPLRGREVVRRLVPSERAQVIKADALRELKQLLHGTPAEQDLLGLMAAAGGGLSGHDLAELTGWPVAEIDDHLRAVSGRTFSSRPSRWEPDKRPVVYLLAHEELQKDAIRYLGDTRLDEYRKRLHIWNSTFRERGWPAETPEYLLRGYFRLISSTGDISQMVACATDQARLDRMLDISKGDATAFAQIATAQSTICDQPEPDLSAMLALGVTRDRLIERSDRIPRQIPAVWASLDNFPRAEALINSITKDLIRDRALVLLVKAVAAAGDYDRAEELVRTITEPTGQAQALAALVQVIAPADHGRATRLTEQAERVACSITRTDRRVQELVLLVKAIAAAGDYDRAEELVRTITEPTGQAQALAALVQVIAPADHRRATRLTEQAEAIIGTASEPESEAQALTFLLRAAAAIGDQDKAIRLAEQAETIAQTITDPNDQAWALIDLVTATTSMGGRDLATRLIDEAETAIYPIVDWFMHMQALAGLIGVSAAAGYYEQAEELTRATIDAEGLAWALTSLVTGMAEAGDYDRAETLAWTITDQARQAEALTSLVRILSGSGDLGRAEALAWAITSPAQKAEALASLAQSFAMNADQGRAARLAEEAEALSHTINDTESQARELVLLARAVASAGDLSMAIRLAEKVEFIFRSTTDPGEQESILDWRVQALAVIGDYERAEEISNGIAAAPLVKARALVSLANAIAAAGDYDRVEEVLRTIAATDMESVPRALVPLVDAIATAGDYDRAEELIRTITEPTGQAAALVRLVEIVAAVDHGRATRLTEQAEAIIGTPAEPRAEAQALTFLLRMAAAIGDQDKAIRLAEQAETIALSITDPHHQAGALIDLVTATVASGQLSRAETIAESIVPSSEQARGLAAIARAAGEMESRRLAALALRQGSWTISLDLLAVIDPSSLLTTADRFFP